MYLDKIAKRLDAKRPVYESSEQFLKDIGQIAANAHAYHDPVRGGMQRSHLFINAANSLVAFCQERVSSVWIDIQEAEQVIQQAKAGYVEVRPVKLHVYSFYTQLVAVLIYYQLSS